jgi:hypothetical protein
MSDNKVCPDCGHDEFHADHAATIRRTYTVSAADYLHHGDEEILDVDRDLDALTCSACESQWQEDDLVTEDAYNDCELSR